MEYINDISMCTPTVVWFYFADYVALCLCTGNGLQKKTDQVKRYVRVELKCNWKRNKIRVLKNMGNWREWQDGVHMVKREVIDQFNYLGKILVITWGWKKQKASVRTKSYQACVASDKCLPVSPNIRVHVLKNKYETLCKSRVIYDVELQRLDDKWKETDKLHVWFCKKILGLPRCTGNWMAGERMLCSRQLNTDSTLHVQTLMSLVDDVTKRVEVRASTWKRNWRIKNVHSLGRNSRKVTPLHN